MNIKSLITILVLGSSSAAMASPSVTVSGRANASWSWGNRVRPMPPQPAPVLVRDHRIPAGRVPAGNANAYYANSDRFDRYDQYDRRYQGRYENDDGVRYPDARPRFTELASEISFNARGAKMPSDQTTVHVGGQLEMIRLDGENGQAFIRQVFVRFADGTGKTFDVNQWLTPGKSITVDLGQRRDVKAMRLFSGVFGVGQIPDGTFTVSGA